ncbi:MAG: hypothetical protein M5R40_17885 [Anaerolineae bacterium]|nr:hypothetical protein [Anaerolineae bacterium]
MREESGQLVRTRLTEVGNKYAQRALHLWVMRLLAGDKRPNPIAAHFDRLKAQGHRYTMATCRNHLATILAGIARSGKPCNWPLQRSNGHLADAESEQVLSAAATGE